MLNSVDDLFSTSSNSVSRGVGVPSEEEIAVGAKFINPVYRKMHSGLITRLANDERTAWLTRFRVAADELDEPTAQLMFDIKNWRSHLAASWMVGYRGWTSFSQLLEGRYETVTPKAQRGFAVGLAALGQPSSADALCAYLDSTMSSDTRFDGSEDWAVAALIELDKQLHTTRAEPYALRLSDLQQPDGQATNLSTQLPPLVEIVRLLTTPQPPS